MVLQSRGSWNFHLHKPSELQFQLSCMWVLYKERYLVHSYHLKTCFLHEVLCNFPVRLPHHEVQLFPPSELIETFKTQLLIFQSSAQMHTTFTNTRDNLIFVRVIGRQATMMKETFYNSKIIHCPQTLTLNTLCHYPRYAPTQLHYVWWTQVQKCQSLPR